jgi:hypothetical protein
MIHFTRPSQSLSTLDPRFESDKKEFFVGDWMPELMQSPFKYGNETHPPHHLRHLLVR